MKSQKFDIRGMTCSACSNAVDRSIKKLDGISEVNVNLLSNSMIVKYDDTKLNDEKIIKTVEDAGYEAILAQIENKKIEKKDSIAQNEMDELKNRLIISLIFAVPLFYIAMGHMLNWSLPSYFLGEKNAITFAFTQFLLAIPIVFINIKYYKVGFKTLFKASPNMDSLIAIGTGAAMLYGIFAIYKIGFALGINDLNMLHKYSMDLYFESAAIVLTLITFGKYLEAKAKGKTSEAINKLMDLAPKKALVLRDNIEVEISVDELKLKDIVIVKPGASIPADGVIISGNTSIDESMLTGESLAVSKKLGDRVIGASINKYGSIKFEVTKIGSDTVLAQIIKLVEGASSSKAAISKLADKISSIFVPTVILISIIATITWMLLGYDFEFALGIGIAILVISCPCALGLATPTAIMVGTGKGAQNGILIKNAEALEIAEKIDTIVLDKTGTITEGKPKVTDIIVNSGINEKRLLQIAYSLENNSEHPLADAIIKKAEDEKIELLKVEDFKAQNGLGVEAKIENETIFIGNKKFLENNNILLEEFFEKSEKLASSGKTPIFISNNKKILGLIAVADVVKTTSKRAIEEFYKMNLEVIMLTGDNHKTAKAIANELNIQNFISEVLPEDKDKVIKQLQENGKKVAMVGDGINDAPALARADVAIAIGAGTDIAIESANIVLVRNDLLDVVRAIELSSATLKNIKQNLFWAFIYNIIGIPLAAGVFYSLLGWKLNPMFAGAAMSLSSVSVVLNALRLSFFKSTIDENLKLVENKNIKGVNMTKVLKVDGMSCGHCSGRVEKALNALEQVSDVKVDLATKEVTINCKEEVSTEVLENSIKEAGYEVIK
ncbi:heavy metal translocating P-type ATPase [Aliarcobacter thereius]|uniref:Copper-transporting ATPase n=2 Tax=Aliarcobacter thereius TaxID=544718 RepID=A0A5R9GW55_9BACT|nr:heavy metal translocating P-type ATPase [Aliarcobacter thereius]OCL92321.1 putative copper-importing P-type ATPase A [Aliarcobacter thereius]OCL94584.1 putative copper-importing P-type ATPase A [Aliarcobacter thereius LMG 24486]QBF15538.1 heavy metal translocating P-type ATPase [Aliarcobacter thereius LMG 24486]TLS70825.1 heavy metal translocating P-type ATPase [Aliarcobacter thereius]TLS91763.1 heavy metal translocating P-type ATPase [Aliarcobacter thereius]